MKPKATQGGNACNSSTWWLHLKEIKGRHGEIGFFFFKRQGKVSRKEKTIWHKRPGDCMWKESVIYHSQQDPKEP